MIVDCAVYDDGIRRPGTLELEDAFESCRNDGSFVWIGVLEPSMQEFDAVRKEFDLHELAVEDAIKAHQRPKIEVYGDQLFVVLKTARYDDPTETVEFAEIQIFMGDDYLISVRHGQASALAEVRKAVENKPEMLRCGPVTVLHAIVDKVVDDYAHVIRGLDNDVNEIEVEVFGEQRTNPVQRIYQLKREVLDFQRNTKPLAVALQRLALGQVPHTRPELANYFRDVEDHLQRAVAEVENMSVVLSDALQANLARVTIRQNEDMRTISAWVMVGAVPTVVGAIYGMNFEHMPELNNRFGYPAVLVFMGLVCFLLWRRLKRAGWL